MNHATIDAPKSTTDERRQKIVSWTDPAGTGEKVLGMSGLEFLTAVRRGQIDPAPVSELIGIDPVSFEPGSAVWRCRPDESHHSLISMVHGGITATLLDSAVGCAVHTMLEAGDTYSTLELSVNYIRPVHAGCGNVLAIGEVIHVGRSIATAEGRLVDEATEKLIAHAKSTLMIRRAA